jgi:hypothetical protein
MAFLPSSLALLSESGCLWRLLLWACRACVQCAGSRYRVGRVMQSSFSVWWVLGRLGAHPQGIEATVVVVQVKRSYTPPRGRHSRPTMHASVLSASHRAKMSCITRQQPACTYAPCPAWHPSDCQRVAKQEMQRTNTASLIKLQHHTQHTTPRLSLPVVHRHARSR